MNGVFPIKRALPGALTALAVLAPGAGTLAAEDAGQGDGGDDGRIEEMVVVGRYYDTAAQLAEERKADSAVINLLGEDAIARAGDSDVAAALRRVSGLTLVNDEFVYVRGLGERYSSTTLNRARVPSVDLTRNVIPLELFPTYVVESLRVQKSYSADQPAAFGGGNIDIRTEGLPDGLVAGVEAGSAHNTANDGSVLSYAGGDDDVRGTDDGTRALSPELGHALDRFRGEIGVQNIRSTLRAERGTDVSLDEARARNRALATLLNREISVIENDTEPDLDVKAYLGNSFRLGDAWEIGVIGSGAYEDGWRESTRRAASFNLPEEQNAEERQATYNVDITGSGNVGARYAGEHEVTFSSLFLRSTDDETAVRTFFNENRQRSGGRGYQDVRLRFEERNLRVNQLRGSHRLGFATRDVLGRVLPEGLVEAIPADTELTWFYSDSRAETDIPNEVTVAREGRADPATGEIATPAVRTVAEAADYRFTNLDDELEDYGWDVAVPVYFEDAFLEISGGWRHSRQARAYRQVQFTLGLFGIDDPARLAAPMGEVFADDMILDPANRFAVARSGANNESYLAATMTDAWFGAVDWTFRDTWRVAAGARWERYRQVAVDWNPYGYAVADPAVTTDPEVLARGTFVEDDVYPSLSLTWMPDRLAETFQIRAGYSETVTRPDLREITGASYVDPLTDHLVFGNPDVRPSKLRNYDLRAEWFFENGDNLTVSAFYKDVRKPIEFFEVPASDTNTAREIVNADSGEIYGVEVEFLKELGGLYGALAPFYLQANLTLQESELVAGDQANAPTNPRRELSNAAPFAANVALGYDAPNARHSATVVYNAFAERLFVAGRLGAPDGFEQPFHGLDATYTWYPTERLTVKAKLRNLLNDSVTIERDGVTTFEEEVGRTFGLSLGWDL
ncbi:MAG: TonB-dependent receptor domain-containing protein [Pseudomonadota bacterium]